MDCRLQIASSGAPAGSPTCRVSFPSEVWRPIPSADGYSASTKGRIRNDRTGRVLKPTSVTSAGYLPCHLNGRTLSVHALVLEAFAGPRPSSPPPDGGKRWMADHRNGIKTDNRIGNLEWVSSRQNTARAVALGLAASGSGSTQAKLTEAAVRALRRPDLPLGEMTRIAKAHGCSTSAAWRARHGRAWSTTR